MEMKRSVFVLINLFIIILLIGGVFIIGWVFINTNLDTKEAEIMAKFTRMQAAAEIYYSRLRYYNGVCSDIGVTSDFTCNESETAYAIEGKLESGWYYCIDSTGFSGQVPYSKGVNTACKR